MSQNPTSKSVPCSTAVTPERTITYPAIEARDRTVDCGPGTGSEPDWRPIAYRERKCRGARLVPREFPSICWEGEKMLKVSRQVIRSMVFLTTLMLAYLLGIAHTFIWLFWR